MVDDVKDITENAESKVSSEALDRSRLARERREAEQRKRLDELRAHAAAAQAQREKRDEDRRRRQAEQRARDDDRRQQAEQRARDSDRRLQVEERKRAIWEASVSRREALLQREKERTERLERARAARSTPRPAFAFGSSTPRLLEPVDSAGFFWAARSTNPLDQMSFFESLAASTTNVMFASAPLTRRASALHLDTSDTDNKDEPDRQPTVVWSSVARRRTDLVPTLPAPRAPGRAYSMTRLDKLPRLTPTSSPSMHHLNRTQTRSGETTPGSRPGSALSNAGVVRRAASAPRKPRPASIAGTGVNTPRGGGDTGANSIATTPSVSRDATTVAGGDAPRRPPTARKPRPLSLHASPRPVSVQLSYSCTWSTAPPTTPGEGKPPLHRKPKPAKEYEKRGKSQSPGRALSPTPPRHIDTMDKSVSSDKRQVSAIEVTQKLEALQIGDVITTQLDDKVNENKEHVESKQESKSEQIVDENKEDKPREVQKHVEKEEQREKEPSQERREEKKEPSQERKEEKKEPSQERREEKKEPSQEKTEENEMTASMMARRITTEEEAKAALAERRRRAREELERQAELERQRLQREAEEEAERQRQEEERQRREEEEARELAALQRRVEEEKLRKAIEAQQELERQEAEKKVRAEAERVARLKEEEEKRRAANEAERLRREEAEREEKERLARKQRVEAIMARTRLRKQAEEEKKQQENKAQPTQVASNETQGEQTNTQTSEVTQVISQVTQSSEVVQSSDTQSAMLQDSVTESKPVVLETEQTSQVPDVIMQQSGSSEGGHAHVNISVPPPEHEQRSTEQHVPVAQGVSVHVPADNGNTVYTHDLLQLASTQQDSSKSESEIEQAAPVNNGNVTADLLGLSDTTDNKDSSETQSTTVTTKQNDNTPTLPSNNGNNIGHISANFIQNERTLAEHDQHAQQVGQIKLADMPKLLDDDFTTHNGHSATHGHPLTLQNAI
ncbi:PREDICTED: MAP7 domain-containing protein 1-like isoform X2 [Papilio xuthus]|uniref:MAP7 domain-containing protein 1-like isoform X2 n=1 Tax=Papilio xuthus TaxID=66420 RepID=A0AAJ7E7L1_PAPXU|nr:PREDICTED: MAP7 domain-containing protein 1-like isoform X2 [Papilio xuthus]